MAGMQRFVTYIYAYENGQKAHNAGYAKVETRGSSGRIEIHFDNNGIAGGEGKASFLYIGDGTMQELPMGVLQLEKGRGMGQFTFHTEMMLDTDISFEELMGIKIVDSNQQTYMSFWKDVELPKQGTEPQLQKESEETGVVETLKKAGKREDFKDAEQESLHTMEIPMRNVFPVYTMEDIWKNLEKSRNQVQLNNGIGALQIELSDLRELPKKYWYMGNNSFLLHGFFNYHYLLFGKLQDGSWFLGVPGMYERQERVMASVFGFPGYLEDGVWYHILED